MTKKELLKSISPRQVWTPLPYGPNQKAIDALVESGELIYDPRCEAAMLPDVWERADRRTQANEEGWEALLRAENPEAHVVRPELPVSDDLAPNAS